MDTGRRNLNLSRELLGLGNLPARNLSDWQTCQSTFESILLKPSSHHRHAATSTENKILLANISTSSGTEITPEWLAQSILKKSRSSIQEGQALDAASIRSEKLIARGVKRSLDDDGSVNLVGESIAYHFEWPSVDIVDKDDKMVRFTEKVVSEKQKRLMEIKKAKNDFVNEVSSSLIRGPNLKKVDDIVRQDLLELASKVCVFDPEFVLKVALYARQELNIRSTCNLLLSYAAFNEQCRPFLKRYFDASIVLPSDWIDVAECYKIFGERALPAALRRVLFNKFSQFDEYQLGKYNKTKKRKKVNRYFRKTEDDESDDDNVKSGHCTRTLKQLIRMLHIKDPAEYVMGLIGKRYPSDAESFRYSRLSGSWDESRSGQRMKLLTPETWETQLSANGNNSETWERLIDNKKLPYMAMLRNVRNLILANISKEHHSKVLNQLSNKWAVIKSRQFPYRFLTAKEIIAKLQEKCAEGDDLQCHIRKNIQVLLRKQMKLNAKLKAVRNQQGDMEGLLKSYTESLDRAMEIAAFFNVPPIEGTTLILVDISYPMLHRISPLKGIGSLYSVCDIAMLLGEMCSRVCEQGSIHLFFVGEKPFLYENHAKKELMISMEDLDDRILTMYIRNKKKIDNLVVFTLEEEVDIISHFAAKYRLQVDSKLLYFNVCLASRRTDVSSSDNEENNIFLSGFSEGILRFIAERGGGGRLGYIDRIDVKYKLKPLPKPPLTNICTESAVSLPPTVEGVVIQKWRTLRVFISSTFMDMHGERDLLIRYVFPELRSRAKRLFLDVHDVDLRWGIVEEATSGSAMEVCLTEISKCQLFIGILGERYGSVVQSPPDWFAESDEFSWVMGYPSGRSITELEFQYAALANAKSAKDRAFFFLRDNSFLQNIPNEFEKQFVDTNTDGATKLIELKDRVRQSGLEVFDGYPCEWKGLVDGKPMVGNLEMFGQRVLNNLWNALMKLHVDRTDEANVDVDESAHHVAFARRTHETFVGRYKLMETFQAVLMKFTNGKVLVSGKQGSGKTAVMGHLGCIVQDNFPTIFCFVGTTSGTSSFKLIISFLCDQLRRMFGNFDVDIPAEQRGTMLEFSIFLEEVHKLVEKLFIFIDGLDILDGDELNKGLEWLNADIPKSVVVVFSAADNGLLHKAISQTVAKTLCVTPMEMPDRMQLARYFLAKHRKFLDEGSFNNQLRSLMSKFESGLPLYVYLACEELRSFGVFEKVTEHISEMSSSVDGLFKSSLLQLETDFGVQLIEATLGIVAVCKEGLHEEDVYQLLGSQRSFMSKSEVQLEEVRQWVMTPDVAVPRAVFANMMRALRTIFETQNQPADSILRVPHRKAIAIIRARYSKNVLSVQNEKKMHRLLAVYFWLLADVRKDGSFIGHNTRALSSMLCHLLAGGCYAEAEDLLSNLNYIRSKFETELHHQLMEEYISVGTVKLMTRTGWSIEPQSTDDCVRLNRFKSFVSRNFHILEEAPYLTLQQALNDSDGSIVQSQAQMVFDECAAGSGRVLPLMILRTNKPKIDDDQCQMTLTFGKAIRTAVLSPHGDLVAVGEANIVRLYCADSGKEIRSFTGHVDAVTQVLFLSNAKLCSASLDTTISIWDTREGHRLSVLCGHTRPVSACCSDRSGKTLVSVGWDSTVRLWSTNTGKEISVISVKKKWSPFNCVVFHPQRQMVVTGSWDGVINVWDVVNVKLSNTLRGHRYSVRSVDVSPDGTHILSTSLDCTLKIWSFEHGYQVTSIRQVFPFTSAIFSPYGSHILAVGASRTVKIYSAEVGDIVMNVNLTGKASLTSLIFKPDGSSVTCGFNDGSLNRIDVFTGRSVSVSKVGPSPITCMCYLASNKSMVVVGMRDGSLPLLDSEGDCFSKLGGHTSFVTALASSSNFVLSGSEQGQLLCHESPDELCQETVDPLFVWNIHCGAVTSIAFKWDGMQFATTSADQTAQVWSALLEVLKSGQADAPEPLMRIDNCHNDTVTSCCWVENFDTNHLLVTASLDLSVCAWNSVGGVCAWKKTGLDAPVTFLMSSRTIIVVGALSGNIEVWSPEGVSISTIAGSGENGFAVLFPSVNLSASRDYYEPTSTPSEAEDENEPAQARHLKSALESLQEVLFARSTSSGLIEFVKPCFSKEKEILCGHSDDVLSVCCSTDGTVVTASSDKTVRIWKSSILSDADSSEMVPSIEHRHLTEVTSLTHCKISGHIATGDRHGSVILWKIGSKEQTRWRTMGQLVTAHNKAVTSIVFCSNRERLFATGSDDTFVKVWCYSMATIGDDPWIPHRSLLKESVKSKIEQHYIYSLVKKIRIGSPVICMAGVLNSNTFFVGTTKNRVISVDLDSETKSCLTYIKPKSDDDEDAASQYSLVYANDSSVKSWIVTLIVIGEMAAENSKLLFIDSFGDIVSVKLCTEISELVPKLIANVADLRKQSPNTSNTKLGWPTALHVEVGDCDKKLLLTFFIGGANGEIVVHDTNNELAGTHSIRIAGDMVRGLSLTEMSHGDPSIVCTGSADGLVRIWTMSSSTLCFKQIGQFNCKSPVMHLTCFRSISDSEIKIICGDLLGNVYFLATKNVHNYI